MPPRGEDRTLQRELRRYRALRWVGWTDDLCEGCKRKLWNRAGAEDLHGDAGKLPVGPLDVLCALAGEGRVLGEIAERKISTDADRARLRLIAARLVRAYRLFDGRRP